MMRATIFLICVCVLSVGCSSSDDPSDQGSSVTSDDDNTADDDASGDGDDDASDGDAAAADDDASGDDVAGGVDAGENADDASEPEPEPEDAMDAGMVDEPDADLPALDEGPGEFDPDFATSDAFFTRMAEPRVGLASSPHNVVQIFYSKNIEPVIEQDSFEAPPGTVAIKTQDSNDSGSIDTIMVMIKQEPGSSPETDDWLYQRRRANGNLDAEGSPALDFCVACHAGWPETDALAGTTLD
jgi:hypothetical protein